MTNNSQSLRQLADLAGADYDEALVTLWDAGIEEVDDIDSKLSGNRLKEAARALGIPNAKEMQSLAYWSRVWGLSDSETRVKLQGFGIHTSSNARTLPKGALRKLRKISPTTPAVTVSEVAQEKQKDVIAEPNFVFRTPGHKRSVKSLSAEEISQIHEALTIDFLRTPDPIYPPGVRDENLLASAAFRPDTALGGERKYPTPEMAAAALLHSLVLNHAFHNGNKRVAIVSTLVFLDRHDILLTCTEKDLFRQVLRVAQHQVVPIGWSYRDDREVIALADWICSNSRPVQRGDRILKWNELRQILTNLGCAVGNPLPGNRVKITREVQEKLIFGIKRQRILTITASCQSNGSEVDQSTLAWIRKNLRLDDENGYDSAYFYRNDKRTPDEFIAQYRTLLKRLAKL